MDTDSDRQEQPDNSDIGDDLFLEHDDEDDDDLLEHSDDMEPAANDPGQAHQHGVSADSFSDPGTRPVATVRSQDGTAGSSDTDEEWTYHAKGSNGNLNGNLNGNVYGNGKHLVESK